MDYNDIRISDRIVEVRDNSYGIFWLYWRNNKKLNDSAKEVLFIGILVSLDPIAVDQACLDLVYAFDDPGWAYRDT